MAAHGVCTSVLKIQHLASNPKNISVGQKFMSYGVCWGVGAGGDWEMKAAT